jgi:hypothetical protein
MEDREELALVAGDDVVQGYARQAVPDGNR